jgi:hypothetical protein
MIEILQEFLGICLEPGENTKNDPRLDNRRETGFPLLGNVGFPTLKKREDLSFSGFLLSFPPYRIP